MMSNDERILRGLAKLGHIEATIWFGGGGLVLVHYGEWWGFLLVGFILLSWPIDAAMHSLWRAKGYTWENDPKHRQNIFMQAFFAVFSTVGIVFMLLAHFKIIQ